MNQTELRNSNELTLARRKAPPPAEATVTHADLELMRLELRTEIVKLEGDLLQWIFFVFWSGSMVALCALIVWVFQPR
jgi:hypothetical protein